MTKPTLEVKSGFSRLRVDLTYDGTNFSGWGKQPDRRTVQEEVEKAIATVTQSKIDSIVAGRTDAGGNPVIRGALANAPKWVQSSNANQTASDTEGNTLVGGAPVLKASMRVSFDPNPVDSLKCE